MERRAVIRALVSAALVIAGSSAYAQSVIKIAVGAPLTGPLAKQGQEVANAVKLAADEWNARGGVLGRKIQVVEADDQGNPQIGVAAAEKVVADSGVVAAVWGITSVTCIPVSEILQKANLALITPGCTNPRVTDRRLNNTNRICARDDAQAPAAAEFAIRELKAKKIAIFDDGTTGPKGFADEFDKKAKALGAQTLRYQVRAGDKDFRAILGTVPKDIDLIVPSLWAPESALMAKQLQDVALDVPMIGGDGQFEVKDYIEASGGAAEGNYVTFLAPDMRKVPAAAKFVKAYEAQHGALSSYGPLAYEAANIILESIRRTGKAERAAVRDAIRATKGYQGILGTPITFDDKGDTTGGLIFVYQVKGLGFEQVKTIVVK